MAVSLLQCPLSGESVRCRVGTWTVLSLPDRDAQSYDVAEEGDDRSSLIPGLHRRHIFLIGPVMHGGKSRRRSRAMMTADEGWANTCFTAGIYFI